MNPKVMLPVALFGLVVLVLLASGIPFVGFDISAAKQASVSFDDMRKPVVRVLTKFAVWEVEIKAEWREPFLYSAGIKKGERLVQLEPGQRSIWIDPRRGESFVPQVWVGSDNIYCGVPTTKEKVFRELEPRAVKDCDRYWGIIYDDKDWLSKAQWDNVISRGGSYRIQIIPSWVRRTVTVRYPYFEKLASPYYYSLESMTRYADANKVNETIKTYGYVGTGLVGYSGETVTREYTSHSRTYVRSGTVSNSSAYGTQTVMLTNWHMISPVLDDELRINTDDKGAVWKLQQVVTARSYVQLTSDSRWLEVRVGDYSADYDLAMLWIQPKLPGAPTVNWLPADDMPEEGEAVYIVGHPLGIANDVIGEGILSSLDHVPQPGVPMWGRSRYLLTIPTRGGSSGSPIYIKRDGLFYAAGILHAGYGEVYGNGEWTPGGDVNDTLEIEFKPRRVEISDPNSEAIASRIFIPAPYSIAISIDDVAQFVMESGQNWAGLGDRIKWK